MVLVQRNYHWQNWVGTQRCVADLYEPTDLPDLQRDVSAAVAGGGPVRAVGAGHSWSALVNADGGSLISTRRMNRVLAVDPVNQQITVEAGATIEQLARTAEQYGMLLHSPPIFDQLSIGGAVAVGAHGTGKNDATLSDSIVAMTIVDAKGDVRTVSEHQGDLSSASTGLGLVGVIYSVTFRCKPTFTAQVERRYVDRKLLANPKYLQDLLASYEYVDLYWYLSPERVWVRLVNPTKGPPDPPDLRRLSQQGRDRLLQIAGGAVLTTIAARFPKFIVRFFFILWELITPPTLVKDWPDAPLTGPQKVFKWFEQGLRAVIGKFADVLERIVPKSSVDRIPAREAFHYIETIYESLSAEYSICTEYAAEAWKGILNFVEENTGFQGEFPYAVNLTVHARFIGEPSQGLRNPSRSGARTRKGSCYIEVVTLNGTPFADKFYEAFHRYVNSKDSWDARPNWGKLFSTDASDTLRRRLGMPDAADQFSQYRNEVDDAEHLANDLTRPYFDEP